MRTYANQCLPCYSVLFNPAINEPPNGGPQKHARTHNPICIDANINTRESIRHAADVLERVKIDGP